MVGKAQAITNSQVPARSVAWIHSSTQLLAAVSICSLNHSTQSLGKSREIVTQWTRLLWAGCSCFTRICHLTSSALWPFFCHKNSEFCCASKGEKKPQTNCSSNMGVKTLFFLLSTSIYYEQEIQKRLIKSLSPHSWITQWFLQVCFAAKSVWLTFTLWWGKADDLQVLHHHYLWPFFVWFCGKTHNGEKKIQNQHFVF